MTATPPPPARWREVGQQLRLAAQRVGSWPLVRRVRAHPVRWTVVALGGVLLAGGIWAQTCGLRGCPSLEELRAFRPSEGGRVLDRAGRTLGYLRPVRRITISLDKIPTTVQEAFIAVEDRRFLEHDGLDWQGAARAFVVNLKSLELRQGSSTITMQAARSAFLDRYEGERSVRRKLIELHLAGRLEAALSKPQILELYLNSIYLGDGTYGVEAASRHFFGKSVSKLTLAEAALLAGLPRAPSSYDPRRNPARARARRDLVLSLMAEQQYIDSARARNAQRQPVRTARAGWRPDGGPSDALEMVRAAVDSLAELHGWNPADLVVQSTFDVPAQRAAAKAVHDRAAAIGRGRKNDAEPVQGAMVAMDPQTGELRAVVGSASLVPGGLNRSVRSRRQPGSAFKPFIYAAALEHGYTPATLVDDSPVEVRQQGRIWRPDNFGSSYRGTVTLREALVHSLNGATVRVSQSVGIDTVVALSQRVGITSTLQPLPSLALGSSEVTPLELVRAYAPFGNGGWRVTPHFLVSIRTRNDSLLWQADSLPRERALDERDAFLLTTMLQAVVDEGTGNGVRSGGVSVPVAGKTGTSNDGADLWFVGYTRTVVAGFWFGYDTPRSLGAGATGGRFAVPAWAAFYRQGWRARDDAAGWEVPDGVFRFGGYTDCGFLGLGTCVTEPEQWLKEGSAPPDRPPPPLPTEPEFLNDSELGRRIEARVWEEVRRALREASREAIEAEQAAGRRRP